MIYSVYTVADIDWVVASSGALCCPQYDTAVGAVTSVEYGEGKHAHPLALLHVELDRTQVIAVYRGLYEQTCTVTVEPLNNVTFGTSYSVHYREVSSLRRL